MTVRYAVLGAGGMGRHLGTRLAGLDGAAVTAVYDPVSTNAERLAEATGAAVKSEAAAAIGADDVDAVVVATPCATHVEYAVAAAAAGRHVFCEKPLALSLEGCDEVLAAADAAGVRVAVDQVLRHFPRFEGTKRLVEQGAIGELRAISIVRTAPMWPVLDWRSRLAESGGLLLEINVHEFDHIRWLAGDPVSVYAAGGQTHATTDFEEFGFLTFRFASGVVANLHTSLGSRHDDWHALVEGTTGTIRNDADGFGRPGRLSVIGADGEQVTVDDSDLSTEDPFSRGLREFTEWVEGGSPPTSVGWDGRMAVAMGLAARRSMETGDVVEI